MGASILEAIAHDPDGGIPARPAVAALHALLGCRADMGRSRHGAFPGMHATYGQPVSERELAVDEVRGETDAEIRWDLTAEPPIRLRRLVLPRRQPEPDPGLEATPAASTKLRVPSSNCGPDLVALSLKTVGGILPIFGKWAPVPESEQLFFATAPIANKCE
jgi:hypothetical protein